MRVNILRTVKWVLIALAAGFVCGLVGTAFHLAIDFAGESFKEKSWLLYLLPLAGIIIVVLYKGARLPVFMGTDTVFEATRDRTHVPVPLAPLIFVCSFLTHLCGGSSGREGAALQLGGGIASLFGRILRLNDEEMHTIEMCGMGALFSALFGTPVGAAFFVIEVIDVGFIHYRALLPGLISTITAFLIAGLFNVSPTRFALADNLIENSAVPLLKIAALALLSGLLAIAFCELMHSAGKLSGRLLKNDYLRIVVGAAIVIGLTFVLGTRDYNGGGMHTIKAALEGNARPEAFLIKLLMTAITLASGFKGGEIVPCFFVGSTFGCVVGGLIGLDPALGAAIGMMALFGGVTNTPAATILLAAEIFSGKYIIAFALAIGISYFISGRCSLYHSQAFLESKFSWEKTDNI